MKRKNKKNEGFVILFAVAVSSLLLAIALGVANIALKEIQFGTSAKETNISFLAADTGAECAMYSDKGLASFPVAGPASAITCNGQNIPTSYSSYASGQGGFYTFKVLDLTDNGSCAVVIVDKSIVGSDVKTSITSKGYNLSSGNCAETGSERVERQLKISYFEKNPIPPSPLAFGVIPGTIQAEDYDTGGEGVAYHDTSSGNSGGAYRNDDVDIQNISPSTEAGLYNLGWVRAGEWLQYSVNVTSAGTYIAKFRVSSPGTGGKFHLEVDGVNVTGNLDVPDTGSFTTWADVTKNISLSAGGHILKLVMDTNGNVGYVGNFNYMNFSAYNPVAPTFVDAQSSEASTMYGWTNSKITINKPANMQVGDVMIASIGFAGTSSISAPDGWTLIKYLNNSNTTQNILATYYKVAGSSESDTYQWTTSYGQTNKKGVGGIVAFRGVDTTNPINVQSGQNVSNNADRTSSTPSVTSDTPNGMVVAIFGVANDTTWSQPSGMTQRVDKDSPHDWHSEGGTYMYYSSTGYTLGMFTAVQVQAGVPTGIKTATQDVYAGSVPQPDYGNAQILVLKPL